MKAWLTAAALALATPGAFAQQPLPAPGASDHMTDLATLSEVLGEAHYIRRLCYGRGDQRWRDQQMHLMDFEGPAGTAARKVMSDAFNNGYRTQEERFPACTPEAQSYENALNAKGARLANALAARYRD